MEVRESSSVSSDFNALVHQELLQQHLLEAVASRSSGTTTNHHPLLLHHNHGVNGSSPLTSSWTPFTSSASRSPSSSSSSSHPKIKSHSFRREKPSSLATVYRGNPYDLFYPPPPLPSQTNLPVSTGDSSASFGLTHPGSSSSPSSGVHSRLHRRCSDPSTSVINAVMAARSLHQNPLLSLTPHHIPSSFLSSMMSVSPSPLAQHRSLTEQQDLSDDDQPLDMSTKNKHHESRGTSMAVNHSHPNKLLLPFAAASLTSPGSISSKSPNAMMMRPSVITCAPSTKRGKLEQTLGRLEGMSHGTHHHSASGHKTATVTRHSSFGGSSTSPSISSVSSSSTHSQESDGIADRASKLQILSHGSSSDEEASDPVMAHFKRSLGRSYSELIRSKSSPISCPSTASSSSSGSSSLATSKSPDESKTNRQTKSLVINGDAVIDSSNTTDLIDDHFAKALGDQWLKIKTKSVGGSGGNPSHSPSTNRYDDSPEQKQLNGNDQTKHKSSSESSTEDKRHEIQIEEEDDRGTKMEEDDPPLSPGKLVVATEEVSL